MTKKTYILLLVLSILFLNPLVLGVITLFAPCEIVRGFCVGKFMGVPPGAIYFFSIGAIFSLLLISFLSIRVYKVKSETPTETISSNWIKLYLIIQLSLFGLNFLFLSLGNYFGHSLFTTLFFSAFAGVIDILFWVYLCYLLKNNFFGISAILRFFNLAGMILVNILPIHQKNYVGFTSEIIRYSLLGIHFMISVSLFFSFWNTLVAEARLKRFRTLAIVILVTSGIGVFLTIFSFNAMKEANMNSFVLQMSVRKIMEIVVLGFYFYVFWTFSKEEISLP